MKRETNYKFSILDDNEKKYVSSIIDAIIFMKNKQKYSSLYPSIEQTKGG
ncbi:MAG: hypothetical protein LBF97_06865 [Elusimicrobiota bacterium]|jgi:hypothetical protein|nr:hypothetical protein [Elusimicrobiota bacterium]